MRKECMEGGDCIAFVLDGLHAGTRGKPLQANDKRQRPSFSQCVYTASSNQKNSRRRVRLHGMIRVYEFRAGAASGGSEHVIIRTDRGKVGGDTELSEVDGTDADPLGGVNSELKEQVDPVSLDLPPFLSGPAREETEVPEHGLPVCTKSGRQLEGEGGQTDFDGLEVVDDRNSKASPGVEDGQDRHLYGRSSRNRLAESSSFTDSRVEGSLVEEDLAAPPWQRDVRRAQRVVSDPGTCSLSKTVQHTHSITIRSASA
eukprot:763669-Hanusia_phi.AAC.1